MPVKGAGYLAKGVLETLFYAGHHPRTKRENALLYAGTFPGKLILLARDSL